MSGILKPVLGSQLQLGHPLSTGLKLCLLANEGSGDVYDLSGNGKTGVNTATSWIGGDLGYVLSFNGSTSSIQHPALSSTVYGTNPRTIFVRFNASAFDTALLDPIYRYSLGGGAGNEIAFFAEDNGVSCAFNGHRPIWGKGTLSTDTWYDFVAVVPNGAANTGDMIAYIDGVLKTPSDEAGGSLAMNTASGVGTLGSTAQFFTGKISFVMIWDRALSSNGIAQLCREPFAMFDRDPIELWSAASPAAAATTILPQITNAYMRI